MERLANWAAFRLGHNAAEGDRAIVRIAAASGLRFRTGPGSCVIDSYSTATAARFTEIACLVAGPRAASVVVGAAPPSAWAATAPTIERAISALRP